MMNQAKILKSLFIFIIAFLLFASGAQNTTNTKKEWVTKSNGYTKLLIEIDEKYSPELHLTRALLSTTP